MQSTTICQSVLAMFILYALATPFAANAQSEKEAALAELSRMFYSDEQLMKIREQTLEQMMDNIRKASPNASPRALEIVRDEFTNMLVDMPEYTREFGQKMLADNFSERELRDLIAFYSTATGQKIVRMMPALAAQIGEFVSRWVAGRAIPAQSRIRKRLMEEGIAQ